MSLNPLQLTVVKHYGGGDFADVQSMKDCEDVGDTLFLFIMRELEDVSEYDEAERRLEMALEDLNGTLVHLDLEHRPK